MPNTKDIKRRIKSVNNTQKITRAMKMVAAAKVKKTETLLKSSLPYSDELLNMMNRLILAGVKIEKTETVYSKPIENYPVLLEKREIKTVGLLVVTSDKGLAGAYNSNVARKTMSRIRELQEKGINVKLFIVGNKGFQALKKTRCEVLHFYTKLPALPTPGVSAVIAENLAEKFVDGTIDKIEIITTYFKSTLTYQVQLWQIFPLELPPAQKTDKIEPEMLFEPSPEIVLQKLVPLYLSNRIFHALVEAGASEQAARMQAMSSATKNAGEMIKLLTIAYNKARQANITQELLEVVNGAEALKG